MIDLPRWALIAATIAGLAAQGCGEASGTWNDDAKNWSRSFKTQKPDDVKVLHSRYWRSPHVTYEYAYFFEIEKNDDLRKQLFSKNKLVRVEGKEASQAMTDVFGPKPEWFIPRPAEDYEIYRYESEPAGHFHLWVDKKTGALFLADHQV